MSEVYFKFDLGEQVEDIVTGFKGTVTARVQYFNECIQYCVKPKIIFKKDTKMELPIGEYFDEQQLKTVKKEEQITPIKETRFTGGPQMDAPL